MDTHTTRRPWLDWLIALLILALALVVYNATLTPSLSYKSPDGNELATIPYILGLAHSTGYPLYTWLGKLFTYLPIGDVAHRMNLMSAVLGAAGVAILYGIVLLITRRRLVAAFTALLFAFSLAFWSQTGIAEVYAPNVFMVTLTVWLLLKWGKVKQANELTSQRGSSSLAYFLTFCLAFGLSLGTHLSNLGFAPAFALYILLVDWRMIYKRPWVLLLGALLFVLGCLQFLWLPYKASTLNDPLMMRDAPRTLEGIYRYTLGAFPQMKFAFPLWAIPDRIVLYLYLLRQNLRVWGILLGLYGMMEMAFRDVKKFYLFIGMYLVHVFFFVQYRVFDLDVFFIPAHLLYAIFIGYGVHRLVVYLYGFLGIKRELWRVALNVGLALLLAFPVANQVQANWEANDYSDDTAINDFYENVWQILPQGSVLIGQGGVFGYDMFYWRLAYNVRPDVLIPMIEGPRPSPRAMAGAGPIYTTQPTDPQQPGRGPWSPPAGLLKPDSWYIPVLLGKGGISPQGHYRPSLTLYRVSDKPPELVIQQAQPEHFVGQPLGGLELMGYDLDDDEVSQGGCLHLTLYWRVRQPERVLIATSLGDTVLEAHDLGLGNLGRYEEEYRPPRQGIVVEDYLVVVPSHIPLGSQTLSVSLQQPFRFGEEAEVAEVIELTEVVVME
jgi:hypothetical protein